MYACAYIRMHACKDACIHVGIHVSMYVPPATFESTGGTWYKIYTTGH